MVISKKTLFFPLLTRKPKFIVILKGLQYQFLSSCLKQTTRGAVSAKSSSEISCSVVFVFAFRHERLKSLPSWNWKQTPASRVLGACTITAAQRRLQRQSKYTKTLKFCDCLKKFLQTFLWIFFILEEEKRFCKRPWTEIQKACMYFQRKKELRYKRAYRSLKCNLNRNYAHTSKKDIQNLFMHLLECWWIQWSLSLGEMYCISSLHLTSKRHWSFHHKTLHETQPLDIPRDAITCLRLFGIHRLGIFSSCKDREAESPKLRQSMDYGGQ